MIRVLHVVDDMSLGGAESRIMDLYRNIDTSQVQFDFAVHETESACFDSEIRERGGRIYIWPKCGLRTFVQYVKEVNSFFKKHPEYQIVHGHITSYGMVYQLIAKRNGVKTRIGHARSSSTERNFKGFLTKLMVKPLKYCVNTYFACSFLAGQFVFGKKLMQAGKVRIINNAIDSSKFRFSGSNRELVRQELGLTDELIVGHVGNFRYAKNHGFLLEVFKQIHKVREDAVLLLVGDGKLRDQIVQKARSLGIFEKVIFTGKRMDVAPFFSAMDILIFPSFYEGLPGAVVEAQAAGLRCLVADTVSKEVGFTELISFLGLQEGADLWASRALENLDYPRRDMYHEIVSAGFDIKSTAKELQEFYLSCVR